MPMNALELSRSLCHDPASALDRMPVGAVAAGSRVALSLFALSGIAGEIASCEVLVSVMGSASGRIYRKSMQAGTASADRCPGVRFRTSVTACDQPLLPCPPARTPEPCVLRYAFELTLCDGRHALYVPMADNRSTAGEVVFTTELRPDSWFQITAFDGSFTTPEWLQGSIMYQVFPDRFARGGKQGDLVVKAGLRHRKKMKRDTRIHKGWDEEPDWDNDNDKYDPVDFFGGTLVGIEDKLPYLASLGVEVLYLNPVFEARSNHRYDTSDYEHIDPVLGTDDDFERLCAKAKELGIHIMLDAVLSHTGDDSRYFNHLNTYPTVGAWQGSESEFYSWYDFDHPCEKAPYRCWWGFKSLPEVDELDPKWQRYILGNLDPRQKDPTGFSGVLPTWISRGADGFRLDVADELPDSVLEKIRQSVKGSDPDAAVLGEVWEDATTKVSYNEHRTYALGKSLDSVMNYPLRKALLDFALGIADSHQLATFLTSQQLNYPPALYRSCMNLLSSHDVERVRSVLSLGRTLRELDRNGQVEQLSRITPELDVRGAKLQSMLAALLYCLPGMPTIYYGDELGMQGAGDPFDRRSFPQTADAAQRRSDVGQSLTDLYRELGAFRKNHPSLRNSSACFLAPHPDVVAIVRNEAICLANRSARDIYVSIDLQSASARLQIPIEGSLTNVRTGNREDVKSGVLVILVKAESFVLLSTDSR